MEDRFARTNMHRYGDLGPAEIMRGLGSTLRGIPKQYEQYSAEPQEPGASFNGKWGIWLGRMGPIKAPQPPGGLKEYTFCGASCNKYGPALYKLENVVKTVRGQIWMQLVPCTGLD